MANINNANCPMLRKNIDIAYCIELRMIADNEIYPTEKEKYLTKEDFEKCHQCEMRRIMRD